MSDNKSKKMPGILARLRMVVGLNIGTIMFGILFIYMAFSAILYFTTTHIESYQVTSGPLSRNETYTGLAIREESLCKADSSGYITYYAREGSKINASGARDAGAEAVFVSLSLPLVQIALILLPSLA